MAYFTGSVRSSVLDMDTQLTVVLPQDHQNYHKSFEKPKKTVLLLHGLKQNASSWTRFSCAEGCALHHNFALIIPEVQRSWYTDMAFGLRYFTYVTEELPMLAADLFGLPVDRESLCVAGLSMGGYGALKCALRRPDVFSAAASFSGALDTAGMVRRMKQTEDSPFRREMTAVFGEHLDVRPEDDVFELVEKAALLDAAAKPKLYVCCGTEDGLIAANRRFDELIKLLPYEYKYMEWAGIHDWVFWEKAIEYALDFFDGVDPQK